MAQWDHPPLHPPLLPPPPPFHLPQPAFLTGLPWWEQDSLGRQCTCHMTMRPCWKRMLCLQTCPHASGQIVSHAFPNPITSRRGWGDPNWTRPTGQIPRNLEGHCLPTGLGEQVSTTERHLIARSSTLLPSKHGFLPASPVFYLSPFATMFSASQSALLYAIDSDPFFLNKGEA